MGHKTLQTHKTNVKGGKQGYPKQREVWFVIRGARGMGYFGNYLQAINVLIKVIIAHPNKPSQMPWVCYVYNITSMSPSVYGTERV